MARTVFTILVLLIAGQLSAQRTVLYGKAPDYSSREISFYTITEPILHEKTELATTTVANDGSFSVIFSSNQTIEIYTDLEKYCGTMVVEPGKNYHVELPPFSPRTSAEANSVFFKPAQYWLGLPGTDNSDINFSVRSFITDYNAERVKNATRIYQQKSTELLTEIIQGLEKKYGSIHHPYFKTLTKYSYAELENIASQKNPDVIIRKYFAAQPIEPGHSAYQHAFEAIFTDFLRKQSQDILNKKIVTFTDSGNYTDLVAFFENKGYKREFAELVVLKGLFDGYYTGTFSKAGVIRAVEMAQSATSSTHLQIVAGQIRNKLSLLAVGGKAPAVRLPNMKNESVTLDQFHGKFVYLSFFNSSSADCRAELDSIVSIEKRLRQVLSVVSISVEDNFTLASNLWNTKGYTWQLLNGSKQKQLVHNYNAALTPAFYLVAPDGTMRLSPAPSPSHGFEPAFLKIIRDYNFRLK